MKKLISIFLIIIFLSSVLFCSNVNLSKFIYKPFRENKIQSDIFLNSIGIKNIPEILYVSFIPDYKLFKNSNLIIRSISSTGILITNTQKFLIFIPFSKIRLITFSQ